MWWDKYVWNENGTNLIHIALQSLNNLLPYKNYSLVYIFLKHNVQDDRKNTHFIEVTANLN